MNVQILNKFITIKQEIELTHGPFILFALFEKNEPPGVDVIFAAGWTAAKPDKSVISQSIALMSQKMLSVFTANELSEISGIIPLSPNHPIVSELVFEVEPSELRSRPYIHLRNLTVHDVALSQAYILAADALQLNELEIRRPLQNVA